MYAFVQQIFVYVSNYVLSTVLGTAMHKQTKMIQKVASIFTFYIWTSAQFFQCFFVIWASQLPRAQK